VRCCAHKFARRKSREPASVCTHGRRKRTERGSDRQVDVVEPASGKRMYVMKPGRSRLSLSPNLLMSLFTQNLLKHYWGIRSCLS